MKADRRNSHLMRCWGMRLICTTLFQVVPIPFSIVKNALLDFLNFVIFGTVFLMRLYVFNQHNLSVWLKVEENMHCIQSFKCESSSIILDTMRSIVKEYIAYSIYKTSIYKTNSATASVTRSLCKQIFSVVSPQMCNVHWGTKCFKNF